VTWAFSSGLGFSAAIGVVGSSVARAEIELFENEIRRMREGNGSQSLVDEEELEFYLGDGWEFVSVLPSRKILIRKEG
jgi:hypothetical protein